MGTRCYRRYITSAQAFFHAPTMSGRQGGKLKPLKAPKKDKKEGTEEDAAFKEKKKAEEAALKAARDKAMKGGAPGGGIKK
ncbi:hypothetical protein D9758_016441 [Tetrapyrgos nigripes]|uniref:Translation machinery associated TMA7 n=1 Tax=Tetrapyrgos nigripes TaxID=182062 RepID=A0A8H5C2W6_9AGAR|nr:hypothetical protein D9758_016441 [Tetrapyrgos nigripes]